MKELSTPLNSDIGRYRNSRSQIFFKISVLKNLANFTEKHLFRKPFLIKLQAFRPATLLKREFSTCVFVWNLRNF